MQTKSTIPNNSVKCCYSMILYVKCVRPYDSKQQNTTTSLYEAITAILLLIVGTNATAVSSTVHLCVDYSSADQSFLGQIISRIEGNKERFYFIF